MCKKSLLMMLLLALFAPWAANAQTLTVCEGTVTNEYIPFYGYWADNPQHNQMIYPASELTAMVGQEITQMVFYIDHVSGTYNIGNWTVKLGETTATTLSGLDDTTPLTEVYPAGPMGFNSGETLMTITFENGYVYHGGNLLVDFTHQAASYKHYYFSGVEATSAAVYQYGTYSAVVQDFLPKVTFSYQTPASCAKPSGLAASDVTDATATLSWIENGTATNWVLQYSTDSEFATYTQENVSTTPSFDVSGLSALTTYYARVKADCGGGDSSEWTNPLTFSTSAVAEAIGDAWSDDFEGASCGWELINGTCTNAWAWGTATNNGGTHALYVSNDGGTSNAYTNNSAAMVYATKLLNFTEGKFEFAYNWMANGESTWDFLRVALVPASVTLTAGTSLPSGLTYSTVPSGWIALDGGSKLNLVTDWQSQSVAVNVPAGNYYLVMAWRDDTSGGTNPPAAIDNVSITKMACPYDVANLEVGHITTTGATLAWEGGEASQWQVAYADNANFTNATEVIVSEATYNIPGLNHSTMYYAKVRAYCGGEDFGSWCNPISFPTECEAIAALGYAENFDSYTAGTGVLPICWNKINTSTNSTYQAYPYIYANTTYSTYANSAPNCLYFYTYGSGDPQPVYAILPEMTGLAGLHITLQAKGSNVSSTFLVGVMTDPADATTFEAIADEQTLTTAYQEFEFDVPAEANGNYVAIMLNPAASGGYATTGLYVDDITITTPPTCIKPTDFVVTTNGLSATCAWVSEVGAYEIAHALEATANPDENIVGTATDTTFTMNELALGDHYFWVRANCGGSNGNSQWVGPVSVHIGYCVPAPTSVDNNGISNVTFGMGDYIVNNDTPKATYADYTSQIGAVQAGVEATIAITFKTSYTYNTYVWVDLDNSLSFDADEVICYGESTNSNPTTLTLSFTIPVDQAVGDFRLRIGSADSGLGTDPTAANPCYTGSYGCFQDYTLRVLEAPSCFAPTGLTVNYTGGTEATVSWTSDAEAWNMRVNGVDVNGVITNPYTLTGLELAMTYEVEVQANCGDNGTSEWAGPVSFTTDKCLPENMCALTFTVTDSYGDGWNGASIQVYDYTNEEIGELLAEITNQNLDGVSGSSQTEPETQIISVNFCDGQQLAIIWNEGSYDSECSYTITDLNEDIVAQDDFELAIAYTMNCTVTLCRKPTDFAVSEIANHSVVLSWTENGPATEWVIEYLSENDTVTTTITVNTNPYTLTGLTPETMYAAQVTPVCEVDKPSEIIYWTTDVACPKPYDMNVMPYPFTADVTWKGIADAYDLEWALVPASESKDALWLQYDNGTVVTNVGNSTIYEWTWAVMYPADMLQGNNMLSKVAFYETSYYSEGDPITINIYSGGDSEPETLVYTENVTCTGTVGIHEVELSSFVNIDPAQNLWITLTSTTIDRPMAMSAVDEANGRWVDNGGWMDIGTALASVSTYTFMIRAYVEPGFDPSTLEWNPVSGVTSPYTLEGLQPETTYVVRVKALCGGDDGESAWTMTTFTTPSACDTPIELEATDITYNAATLNWVGYQDSYNLRYRRTPYVATTYFSEDFDEGLPATWTTIDNDTTTVGNWIALSEINSVYTYYTSPLTGWAHSGADAVASASYVNGAGSVATDNYLVTPQVTFNGKLRFYATSEYEDPDTYEVLLSTTGNSISDFNVTLQAMGPATYNAWDEVIIDLSDYAGQQGYIAIHHVATDKYWLVIDDFGMYDFVYEDWTNVTATENTYTATGLTPEAEYEWQIQGINANCGELEWSEMATFTTAPLPVQTIALTSGKNWVSFHVETKLADLKAALAAAAPTANISIKSQTGTTTYNPNNHRWTGNITLDLAQMYIITINTESEIALQGMPVDPAEHPINIPANGKVWLGFPFGESMTLTDAFAGFAVNGDKVSSQTSTCPYNRGRWGAQIPALEPGKGYRYVSASSSDRTLVFPTGSAKAAKTTVQQPKAKMDASMVKQPRTVDIDLPIRK